MIYKNLSRATKTFYGITFKPGESHDVPGYINDPKFFRCSSEDLSAASVKADVVIQPQIDPTTGKKSARTRTTKEEVISNGTDSDQ